MAEPLVEITTARGVDPLSGGEAIERVNRELLAGLHAQAAAQGLVLGDGPIELMVEHAGGEAFRSRRVTVRAVGRARAPRCGPDGKHEVPQGAGTTSCPCGTVTRVPAGGG